MRFLKPSPAELLAAQGKFLPDILAPNLKILFSGINPSVYSAAVGHHFARPGNRFWPTLHAAGFTNRRLSPVEDRTLLDLGFGLTNIVPAATAKAEELSLAQLVAGKRQLLRKVRQYAPHCLAVLGLTYFRTAWDQPKAKVGLQATRIGSTVVWVLPNPSGLNASYQIPRMAALYREMRESFES
jgi:TDG/mug DNA glycosylase family protein